MKPLLAAVLLVILLMASTFVSPAKASTAELLSNNGFEQGQSTWQAHNGSFTIVSSSTHPSQVHSGDHAAALGSSDLKTKWLGQVVQVVPGGSYTLSGWALKDSPAISSVFLRISWHQSEDGTGAEIGRHDSPWLTTDSAAYRLLSVSATAPSTARSARVKCMLAPASAAQATASFDDLSFSGPKPVLVKVSRVIDGDTVELESGETVRYIGIDTPEAGELWHQEASDKNRELVEGKVVRLEQDVSDTDAYGRLLRYVYVDGLFVNGELVRLGYAEATPYPPDTKHESLFAQLEQEARNAGVGMWAVYTAASAGDVVINEVQYNPAQGGTEEAGAEWLELFNATDSDLSLRGWRIADNLGSDELPSVSLPPRGYLVVAATREGFRANFPSFSGAIVSLADGRIGNGLSNDGDRLILKDGLGNVIDALSYGDDTTIMNPSCPLIAEGHSLERAPAGLDSGGAGDFSDNGSPSPGRGLSSISPPSDDSEVDNGETTEVALASRTSLPKLVLAAVLAFAALACLVLALRLGKRR